MAVASLDRLPEDLSGVALGKRHYACFKHDGHVSGLGATCNAIMDGWLPKSSRTLAEGPVFLIEYYGPGFDPETGFGDMEIWVPLA